MDAFRIDGATLAATVKAQGAELCSLRHPEHGELLWQAGPVWPSHAPNLFPIVGQLTGDRLNAGGRSYPLGRHGFARRSHFTWIETAADRCTLELRDDAETHAHYPFAFSLQIAFVISGDTLAVTYTLRNPGPAELPASIGAHPAFRWPLVDGVPKTAHTLTFAHAEPEPIRRLADGLLKPEGFPTPIDGKVLVLDEALFAADAIVMDRPVSRSVTYAVPNRMPAIDVSWHGFRNLGIWSKAGGDFVCIEPWYGYASPVGFDGPFDQKPGLTHVAPGHAATFVMRIAVRA